MGASFSHTMTLKFDDVSNAERFVNYVNRAKDRFDGDNYIGGDADEYNQLDFADTTNYTAPYGELYTHAYADHSDNNECLVVLDTNCYGFVHPMLVYSAINTYQCIAYHGSTSSCQGEEGFRWEYKWELNQDQQCFELPDWSSSL